MYLLDRPELSDSPEQIYEKCVKKYRDSPDKVAKLLSCKALVKQDADRYEALIRAGHSFPKPELPGGMKAAEMYCVYDEKFAKSRTAGRKAYYDKIKEPVNGKVCPVCGEKGKITLDHFLPKSEYPTLCVAPDNLIPICLECNTEKGTKSESKGYGLPIHLYFDRIPEVTVDGQKRHVPYLYVRLGQNFEAEYYVECPPEWNEVLRRRLSDQMGIYDLCMRFGGFAVIEMGHLETSWQQNIKSLREDLNDLGMDTSILEDKDLFAMYLKSRLRGELVLDTNSWKTALYRAWHENADRLLEWFRKKAEAKPACT